MNYGNMKAPAASKGQRAISSCYFGIDPQLSKRLAAVMKDQGYNDHNVFSYDALALVVEHFEKEMIAKAAPAAPAEQPKAPPPPKVEATPSADPGERNPFAKFLAGVDSGNMFAEPPAP